VVPLRRSLAGEEGAVGLVDVARHEGRRVGVGPRNEHGRDAEHVGREPGGGQRSDEVRGRHQHLAAEVPALLLARQLILEVHAGDAGLDERLHELERVERPAEPGLGVGDDRRHPRDAGVALGPRDLVGSLERVVDAPNEARHAVDRIQRLVRVGVARQVRVRRNLPARDVDRREPGLDHLDRLSARERTERRHVLLGREQPPQPLGAEPRQRVLDRDRAAQRDHVLGVVGPLDAVPAAVRGPVGAQVVRLVADPFVVGAFVHDRFSLPARDAWVTNDPRGCEGRNGRVTRPDSAGDAP
jgi:hypothetical protein